MTSAHSCVRSLLTDVFSSVDTLSRRELFRRLGRAAIVGPVMLATRDQQGELVFILARLLGGKSTAIGRWLRSLWMNWW